MSAASAKFFKNITEFDQRRQREQFRRWNVELR